MTTPLTPYKRKRQDLPDYEGLAVAQDLLIRNPYFIIEKKENTTKNTIELASIKQKLMELKTKKPEASEVAKAQVKQVDGTLLFHRVGTGLNKQQTEKSLKEQLKHIRGRKNYLKKITDMKRKL
ncbi:hypothetical protein K502DRAFT_328603 [Neoconidiobolus thromboides FSU 785]|nr:hypothetical protein K502DRAFT_328603 [Neoconidiobolus thromboides FSU 785]